MPQLDLIIDTYIHAPAQAIATRLSQCTLPADLWPQWNCVVVQDRGNEGIRWELEDPNFVGSVEAWIEAVAADGCVLHAFVRVDPAGRPWPGWRAVAKQRRVRRHMMPVLWSFKDDVEERFARAYR